MSDLRCDWLILCERAYLDENNNWCLLGIFHQSRPGPDEAVANLADRQVVASVRGAPGQQVRLSLDLHNDAGKCLVRMPAEPFTLNAEDGGVTTDWTLHCFVLEVGSYEFQLRDGDTIIATAPLEIFAPKLS